MSKKKKKEKKESLVTKEDAKKTKETIKFDDVVDFENPMDIVLKVVIDQDGDPQLTALANGKPIEDFPGLKEDNEKIKSDPEYKEEMLKQTQDFIENEILEEGEDMGRIIAKPPEEFKDEMDEFDEEEKPKKDQTLDSINNSYTWSDKSYFAFTVTSYMIQEYIKSIQEDTFIIEVLGTHEFEYEFEKFKPIYIKAQMIFINKGRIFYYHVDPKLGNVIKSKHDFSDMVLEINGKIKNENPMRCKNLHIVYDGDLNGHLRPDPSVNFKKLILDENLKEDIYDNTITQLKELNGSNGIILHGIPGVGKSLACRAIINEAISKGFSTCYLTSRVHYPALQDFIQKFISPCIVIFEDVDSLGQNREETLNTHLSDFLQFINGLTEHTSKMVFIATTNYLNHLDKAIRDRPMRFNRKFEFKLPNEEQVDKLIDLYFEGKGITDEQKKLCHNLKFTGAHFQEIRRTCDLLALKRKKEVNQVFDDAVNRIKDSFGIVGGKGVGFK